jgi:hypothetical protein
MQNTKMVMEIKQKNWFRRHWILTIVFIFVIIGIIGAILSPSASPSSANVVVTPTATPASTSEPASTPTPAPASLDLFNIGEKITISDIEYTLTEVSAFSAVGSEYFAQEADGMFIVLSLKVKNNKNNEILLTSNDFKLKDSQDRKYNADISAGIYLNTMGYDSFMFKQLGAGLETNGEVVFDVPENDKGLVLEISGEGLFSDEAYAKIGDVSEL